MKIITIASPDKITQSMFSDFCKKRNEGRAILVLELNSLFSLDVQKKALDEAVDYVNSHSDNDSAYILIKYKIKQKPELFLNEYITGLSDYILKFDLFSTHPEIIKDQDGDKALILTNGWREYIDHLNQ